MYPQVHRRFHDKISPEGKYKLLVLIFISGLFLQLESRAYQVESRKNAILQQRTKNGDTLTIDSQGDF